MIQTEVLVIGGGILGCAAAYYLAKRGISVVLVDKGPLAAEATGATTAGLTLQNRTPDRFPFYGAAFDLWPALGDELDADLGYVRSGSVTVAVTAEEFSRLSQEVQTVKALGLQVELLSPAEATELAPWLTSDLTGVSFCPSDGYVEPELPPKAFVVAATRHGAKLLPEHPVEGLRREGQEFRAQTPQGEISARRVINAAGAWAGRIAAMLNIDLPVTLDPLQAMATEAAPPWLDKVVLYVNRKLTMKQNQSGRVIIGGGWQGTGDLDGGPKELLPDHRSANLDLAYTCVPRMAELKIEDSWVGLEGRSPDRYPFFGELKAVPGFFMLACVHGGFALSPLLGDQLAELMVTGKTSFPMRDFTCREFLPLANL